MVGECTHENELLKAKIWASWLHHDALLWVEVLGYAQGEGLRRRAVCRGRG